MLKQILPVSVLGAVVLSLGACSSDGGFKKTADGLEYKIIKDDKAGRNAATGDIVEIYMTIRSGDSLLFNSRKEMGDQPLQIPVQAGGFKGDWMDGLTLLSAGDSAILRVSNDSIIAALSKQNAPAPPWMKAGGKLEYNIAVASVKSQEEMKKAMEEQSANQMQTDDKLLQDYFASKGITPAKTASGLYYAFEKPGTGETAKKGQYVSLNYTGRLLSGEEFDSNSGKGPFTFQLGVGQVIRGWDEGVELMKKGTKGKFYIPSPLAYGAQSPSPKIPANSVLEFDVELTDIRETPPAQ